MKRLEVEREWSLISAGKPNLEGDRFGNGKPKRGLTHDFKNRTGPAGPTGSTGNRPLIRSGYDKKLEIY